MPTLNITSTFENIQKYIRKSVLIFPTPPFQALQRRILRETFVFMVHCWMTQFFLAYDLVFLAMTHQMSWPPNATHKNWRHLRCMRLRTVVHTDCMQQLQAFYSAGLDFFFTASLKPPSLKMLLNGERFLRRKLRMRFLTLPLFRNRSRRRTSTGYAPYGATTLPCIKISACQSCRAIRYSRHPAIWYTATQMRQAQKAENEKLTLFCRISSVHSRGE